MQILYLKSGWANFLNFFLLVLAVFFGLTSSTMASEEQEFDLSMPAVVDKYKSAATVANGTRGKMRRVLRSDLRR